MNIYRQIADRLDHTGVKVEDTPDFELISGLIMMTLEEIGKDKSYQNFLHWVIGLANVCYKLGLTANHDTALEAGTKLLESLNEK